MSRGMYTVRQKISSVVSARTLAVITAPTGKLVEIHKVSVGDNNNATAFQGGVKMTDLTSFAAGTGFTSVTPQKNEPGDQAAGSTVSVGSSSSTEPTTYASSDRAGGSFNGQLGFLHEPIDEKDRIWIGSAATLGIYLDNPPSTSTDYVIEVVFREVG